MEDLRGSKVIVYFYPIDDTPGCTREACDFRDARPRIPTDAVVLGVSPDTPATHAKFAAKEKLDFPLLADPEKKTLEAYGVWKEKSMYGRKYMGVERTTFLIDPGGRIARVWAKVKVPGHVDEVLENLVQARG